MYLRSLRIKGFKSFPRQTELLFEPGVAVVIGPNGSGKSNVSDAVMWGLGEQSPTLVRGTSMQDVIFAGSDGRRASAVAEVELTFDNSEGLLSIPTPEVSVGRRVARGGETTYFINKVPCRLADIADLTAEMGLGREMHSIIGQGRVESLLAAKPGDRRAMIEEAAGLGRYKRRRERAELKLREVRRNLERARDLEKEAASQLAPLRRQANAAELRRTVEAELAETRGRLLAGELEGLDARLAAERAAAESLAGARADLDRRLTEAEAARLAEEEAFARDVEDRERRAGQALRARYLSERLDSCARIVTQRAELLEEVESSARGELEGLAAELAAGEEAGEVGDGREQLDLVAEALQAAQATQQRAAAALTERRGALADLRTTIRRHEHEAENALAALARLRERRQRLAAELATGAAEAGALAVSLAEVEGQLETAALEALRAEQTRTEAAAALSAADAEVDAARAASTEADAAQRRSSAEHASLEAELEAASAALRELHEVSDDVSAVVETWPGVAPLSGAVECEAGYELAVGAALAQYPAGLSVPGDVDGWGLLSALQEAGVKLARLLVGRPAAQRPAAPFPGSVALLDKVTSDAADIETALRDVVIVDDLRAVPQTYEGIAVTRDGAYYRPSRGELGLAAEVPAALLLERRTRLAGLRDRADAVRAREARDAAAAARARAAAEAAALARAAAADGAADAQRRDEESRRHLQSLQAELRLLQERRARLDAGAESGEAEIERLDAEGVALDATRLAADAGAGELRAAEAAAAEAAAASEREHDEALAAATRARIEVEERTAQSQRAQAERARAARRVESARARSAQLEKRLAGLPAARSACGEVVEVLERLRLLASPLLERLAAEAREAEGRVRDRSESRRLAEHEVELRRSGDDLAERRASAQVEIARIEERRADVGARFEEVATLLESNVFESPADETEAASLAARVERLERRRDGIGPVNPLAEAECARLQEHVDFLREQTRDLEKSLTETEALIAELSGRIEADFGETFTVVADNFARMAGTLFPGGSGRLTVVKAEAEGESDGIGLEVKPARKLGKKLALLSGGERSLVSLAFLLALLLSKPAPFYILDEVEAALDDLNIGLFVSLVRQYKTTTQFIIITHQKRTMEAADVLYGVTMGPDGTSQVVSARMAEEEIEHEQDRRGAAPAG